MSTKLARLAAKLDRETLTGKLAWTSLPPPAEVTRGTDDIITQVYEATYNGVAIRVFDKRVRDFDEDSEQPYWISRFVLQFISDDGLPEWEAENVTGIRELLETIRFKTGKVEHKINAILAP